MEVHPQHRCYRAGGVSREIGCTIQAGMNAKTVSALKDTFYVLSKAGKEAAQVIPEAKHIGNTIAHRGSMLYKIADQLDDKVKSHQAFFYNQLHSLKAYAFVLERQAYNSCIDKVYPEQKLSKLPSVPKDVAAAAKKEHQKALQVQKARNKKWAAQVEEMKRRRTAAKAKRSAK